MYCYREERTGLDSLININGVYNQIRSIANNDTTFHTVIFFENGIYAGDVWFQELRKTGRLVYQLDGAYLISGDTIKVRAISSGRMNNSWGGREVWYKIINKNTIAPLYERPIGLSLSDKSKDVFRPKWYENANPYTFTSVRSIPKKYSGWLLNEDWFFCGSKIIVK